MKRRINTAGRIDSQLLIQVQDEISYWRNVLKRVVAVVRSLAAAGLPYCTVKDLERPIIVGTLLCDRINIRI